MEIRFSIAIFLCFIGATAIVGWGLLVPGPFAWHISQASAVQGGVEALAVILAAAGIAAWVVDRRWRLAGIVLLFALYLRRHHVDLPVVAAVLYVELLFVIGTGVIGAVTGRRKGWHPLSLILLGFLAWSLLLWGLQCVGLGQAKTARLLWAISLLACLFFFARRQLLILKLHQRWQALRPAPRALAATLLAWLVVLFARTNNAYGHDSLWYGLRPSLVLTGEHSIFENLGLVSPVYYFPKIWEVVTLPMAAMNEASFILGLSVALLGILSWQVTRLARQCGASSTFALVIALVTVTLPVTANLALEAKPDLFACVLLIGAGSILLERQLRATWCGFFWVFSLCAVACNAKIPVMPYAAVLVIASFVLTVSKYSYQKCSTEQRKLASLVLSLSLLLCGLALLRTFLLVGVPTIAPEQLVALWHWLGMNIAEPAGTLQWQQPQNWSEVPGVLYSWIFAPYLLEHIVITWPGNVGLVAALALALAPWFGLRSSAKTPASTWPLGLVVAVGALILIVVRFMSKGGDGNYFMVPIVLLCVLTLTALWRRLALPLSKQVLVASLLLTTLFQATYSFVSAAWGEPGTRVLDANFSLSCWDSQATGARILSAAKLSGVSSFLAGHSRETLTVGLMPGEFMWLPRRVEHLSSVLYSRPKYLETRAGFARYISLSGADFLVVPTEPTSPLFNYFPFILDILAQATSVVPIFEDESFKIYRTNELIDGYAKSASMP